jgi:dienelactone hydrolase
MRIGFLLSAALIILTCWTSPAVGAEKDVSFKTEDGWTISGRLDIPDRTTGKVPAVILVHAFEHDRDAYGQYLYPGLAQIISSRGIATLRFDFRGRARSVGKKQLSSFTPDERSKIFLDVRAAIAFLELQPGVDSSRLGIVAEGTSTDAAVKGWAGDNRVRAITLISARLGESTKKQIAASTTPLLLLVSKEDRDGFRDTAEAYNLSQAEETRIRVYKDVGVGTTMFSVWRSEHPKEKPLEDGIADWMIGQLRSVGRMQEVSFQTEDGWTLYGTLRTPESIAEGTSTPGVILIHSSFTDRHIYDRLAETMVKRGLIVLNFDSRGRGQSIGKGELLDLAPDERNNTYIDAKAAVNFMSSKAGAGRIGLLGADRGATYALRAAIGDPRVGALALMTTLINDKEREEISRLEIPLFYLASEQLEAATAGSMAKAYEASRNRGSHLVVFRGGMLGYEIFDTDESLKPALAHWMKEQLSR